MSLSMSKNFIITSGLVLCCIFPLQPVAAQSSKTEDIIKKLNETSEMTGNVMLKPVLKILMEKNKSDPQLTALLKNTRVVSVPRVIGRGNAKAFRSAVSHVVGVDMSLVLEANDMSELIALNVLKLRNYQSITRQAGAKYGRAVQKSKMEGSQLPRFEYRSVDYIANALSLNTVKVHGIEVSRSVLSWLVLHEIAHHVLRHTSYTPVDLAQSRREELQADKWAAEMMQKLNIALWGVDQFMALMGGLETARIALGVEPKEEFSTHPSWATRRTRLRQRFEIGQQPNSPMRMFVSVVEWRDIQGGPSHVRKIRFFVPRRCDLEKGRWFAVVSSKIPGLKGVLACENLGGRVYLYGRAGHVKNRFTIVQPDQLFTDITGEVVIGGKTSSMGTLPSIYHSYEFFGSDAAIGTINIFSAAKTSPLDVLIKPLRQLSVSQKLTSRFESAARDLQRVQGQTYIRFSKGEISQKEFEKRFSDAAMNFQKRSLSILGSKRMERYRALLLESEFVQHGLPRFLQLARKSRQVTGSNPRELPAATRMAPKKYQDTGRAPVIAPIPPRKYQHAGRAPVVSPIAPRRYKETEKKIGKSLDDLRIEKDVRQLLNLLFFGPYSERVRISKGLRPRRADYRAVYNRPFSDALETTNDRYWSDSPVIRGKPGNTKLLVTVAMTDDLIDRKPVAGWFPGGYREVTRYLRRGFPIVRFKLVKPGNTLGLAFDGLVRVNGRWVFMPKPWRAISKLQARDRNKDHAR